MILMNIQKIITLDEDVISMHDFINLIQVYILFRLFVDVFYCFFPNIKRNLW